MIIKNQVIAGFNRGAETYDLGASLQARVAQRLGARLAHVRADRILEVGCGTGLFSQHLLQQFPHAHFLLTDVSSAMLAQCRLRLSDQPRVAFAIMDGETLTELPSFDLIASSMTLHWFKDFAESAKQMKQKLVHGGRLMFAMLTENSLQEWRQICQQSGYPVSTPHFPTLAQLNASFPALTLTVETVREPYENVHDFLTTLKSLGATAPRAGYVPLTPDKMRNILRKFNHPIEMTYEVVYGEYHHI